MISTTPPPSTLVRPTERDISICYSFEKTGTCPRDKYCHLTHQSIPMSRCLVFKHLYPNPDLFTSFLDDDEVKIRKSTKQNAFDAFFLDVFMELRLFGNIEDMFVAGNILPNLHGNVYVRFQDVDSAVAAHKTLENRYYAGRLVHSSFVPVDKLSSSVCHEDNCIHGVNCTFIHPIQISKHVVIQCFPRALRTTPAALRTFQEYPHTDSPYDILHGRSKFLLRAYNT